MHIRLEVGACDFQGPLASSSRAVWRHDPPENFGDFQHSRSQNYELRQRHPKILQNSNINVKKCKRLGKMLVIMGMYSMHLLITEEKNVKNVVFLNYG